MTSTGGSITNANIMAEQIGVPDYRASKAAVNMIMRLLALELAEREVIVGIIGSGSVDTRGILEADPRILAEKDPQAYRERTREAAQTNRGYRFHDYIDRRLKA